MRMVLAGSTLQLALEMALHGGRADAFAAAQAAAVDAVQVLAKDRSLKRFAGALAAQDARKALAELPPAT